MNGLDPTGHFWEELGNAVQGYGWRKGVSDGEKHEIDITRTYGAEEAQKILDYEKNISGFKFDLNDGLHGRSLENQVQIFLYAEALKKEYMKDGKFTLLEQAQYASQIMALGSAIAYLNTEGGNIHNFYSAEELEYGAGGVANLSWI